MEIFAFYFPQFYPIPENDEWWGKGFTDWDLVKGATSHVKVQRQPRRPIHGYYRQDDPDVISHQADLASQYNVAGFNFYHYWFDGKLLLERPLLNLLADKSISTKFCLTWANESWTRQWIGKPMDYLVRQRHEESRELWALHYDYLRRCFADDRYLRINGGPFFAIYRPELIPNFGAFSEWMRDSVRKDGLGDLHLVAVRSYPMRESTILNHYDAVLNFQPRFAINHHLAKSGALIKKLQPKLRSLPETAQRSLAFLKNSAAMSMFSKDQTVEYKYSNYARSLLHEADWAPGGVPAYPSVFPDWDNGPRYKDRATLFEGANPKSYQTCLESMTPLLKKYGTKLLFINAWNEWSESAYLEPDDHHGYEYLEATRAFYRSFIS